MSKIHYLGPIWLKQNKKQVVYIGILLYKLNHIL